MTTIDLTEARARIARRANTCTIDDAQWRRGCEIIDILLNDAEGDDPGPLGWAALEAELATLAGMGAV